MGPEQAEQRHERSERRASTNENVEFSLLMRAVLFIARRSNTIKNLHKKWARRDSNPRPKDYESSALPLRHRPKFYSCWSTLFSCCVTVMLNLFQHLEPLLFKINIKIIKNQYYNVTNLLLPIILLLRFTATISFEAIMLFLI